MPELPSHLPLNRYRTPCADKNDKLGWKHGLTVRWSGVTIGLRCNHPDILPLMQAALPSDAVLCEERESDLLMSMIQGGDAGKGRKNYHIVYNGWDRVARTMDWDEAITAFKESLNHYMAMMAHEHTLLSCLQTDLHGRSVMICPSPSTREQVVATFPEAKSWVNIHQSQDCPKVVLVVDDSVEDFSEGLSPGQVALELLRFASATRMQPQRVIAEAAELAKELEMYRAPGNQTREQYDAFVNTRLTA
jgi:hypothetical protein